MLQPENENPGIGRNAGTHEQAVGAEKEVEKKAMVTLDIANDWQQCAAGVGAPSDETSWKASMAQRGLFTTSLSVAGEKSGFLRTMTKC